MKLLIAIESCLAHQERVRAQFDTWVKDVCPPFDVMVFDGPMLGVPDDYGHLPEKTKAICQWALERNYDFLFKTDTDTYVSIERLLASGFEQHDYSGFVLDWIKGYAYASGPHYWLSRKAMKTVVEADWWRHPVPGADGWEDSKVGGVLAAHGILPYHDYRYAPWERVLPSNEIISCHLSSSHAYEIPMMYEAHRLAKVSQVKLPRVALLFISTGEKYYRYIWPALESAQHFFPPHTPFLWTDANLRFCTHQYQIPPEGHPATITHRYKTFLAQREELGKFEYIFHCDIDMHFVAPVAEEDIFSDGITSTLHPGFLGETGTPERRPQSAAYLFAGSRNQYFCGAFAGGKSASYLNMAETIAQRVAVDDAKNLVAQWYDESHLNRYLYEYPPARILSPSFCYPEDYVDGQFGWTRAENPPVLAALDKGKRR